MDARLRARLRAGTATLRDMQRAGYSYMLGARVAAWSVGKRVGKLRKVVGELGSESCSEVSDPATRWYFYCGPEGLELEMGWTPAHRYGMGRNGRQATTGNVRRRWSPCNCEHCHDYWYNRHHSGRR